MRFNPKQIEKIARQMGMQIENIDATEVIIKSRGGDIIIKNPQISKIMIQGQETFQISGEIVVEDKSRVCEEDVDLIVQKTGITKEKARELLEETGDLALAIKKAQS